MTNEHPSLLSRVRSLASERGLLRSGSRVLVAVSGGADSVALLLALRSLAKPLKLTLSVAHLDHGIRGKAARDDAAFVRQLAKRLDIPCVTARRDVPALARSRGLSLEMAARVARYAFLAATARRRHADLVATAHTADDQAETVILRLARGAGPRGLAGIPYDTLAHGVRVVRPLLDVRRGEIERWLKARRQPWREDESNRGMDFLRNRVRHEVLPLLETQLNPAIRDVLCRTAELFRDEVEWIDATCRSLLRLCAVGDSLRVVELVKQPVAARRHIVRLWLAGRGFPIEDLDFAAVERALDLLTKPRGGSVNLPGRWTVKRHADELSAIPAGTPPRAFAAAVRVPGTTRIGTAGLRVRVTVAPGLVKDRDAMPGRYPARASLNLQTLGRRRLAVRSWRPGDRICPLGMTGSKKLQNAFTDLKVPAAIRGTIPVFECAGEIVWVPGYRVARGWEVGDLRRPALQLEVAEVSTFQRTNRMVP